MFFGICINCKIILQINSLKTTRLYILKQNYNMSEYLDDNLLDPNEYDHVFFENSSIYIYNSDDEKDEEVDSFKTAEDWIDQN